MLSYALLKNHAGLLLTGDYWSLHALHEMVHDINEHSPLVKNKEGAFLGLAYDAAATLRPKDFSGLEKLQAAAGDKFVQDVFLHEHDRVTPHSEKIRAASVSLLWQM